MGHLLIPYGRAIGVTHADMPSPSAGKMGTKVKSAIEEVFIVLCQTLAESHLQPAFGKATDLMGSYKPAEHAADDSLAPLVQFFELVHIGDTIAQMVQVYYDRELVGPLSSPGSCKSTARSDALLSLLLPSRASPSMSIGTTFSRPSCARRSASKTP